MTPLAYIVTALVFSAFFSGMESAFISSNKLRHELNKKNKGLSGKIVDIFYRNPGQFIATMVVGSTLSLVVFGLQTAVFFRPYLHRFVVNEIVLLLCLSVIVTFLVLIAGVLIPVILGKLKPDFSLSLFSVPLCFFYFIFYPVARIMSVKFFSDKAFEKVDLDLFIQQELEDNLQKSDVGTEVKMFQNALDFSNVRLRDCIVPRTEIVACDTKAATEELKTKFVETGLSKIVVYNENIDHIIGYLHSSELFKNPEDWTQYIQSVPIVPETMAANKLMKLLMQEKKSLAVVVDEFGGTSGIITLEDLVEEIFGEIEDEYDTKSHLAKKVAENEYLLSGRVEIDSLNETFGLDLPESDDYVTVAGYILHIHQNFPKLNETIKIGKYTFKILKVTTTKIELVRMKVGDE